MENSRPVVPKVAWLTVNRACNLRCKWCYAHDTNYSSGEEMELNLAKELTLLIADLGIRKITIIGGEPTLWKPLIEFNLFCNNLNIKTSIITNAMRFGTDSFWDKYIQYPNSQAGISIKAFNSESLKQSCGIDKFDEVTNGLTRALDYFKTGVSFVYNSFYEEQLTDVAQYAMDIGAKYFKIGPCTPAFINGKANSQYLIDPEIFISKIVNNYNKIADITNDKFYIAMKFPLCLWPRDFIENLIKKRQINSICQVQNQSGIIFDINGKIMMCNSLFDFPIGIYRRDFSTSDTLIEFLNNYKNKSYYETINSYPSNKCIDCPKYSICAGGCPLMWSVYNPNKNIPGWDI